MNELLQLTYVVSGLIGAVFALLGQAITRRATRAHTAQNLSMAFWEELNAVAFTPGEKPNFAGFSSQTFDSLFKEMAEAMPASLTRGVMRYHWLMKYLEEMKPITMQLSGGVPKNRWADAESLHRRLLARLEHDSDRYWISIFLRSGETCSRELLRSPDSQSADTGRLAKGSK
ncbi:MAG: hypothetical protein JSW71_12100 [Gemmatimonadota bacterium]|nr:MAG: hypothetical protein JSW71_12100 [Gemmatimonadota bacterium]